MPKNIFHIEANSPIWQSLNWKPSNKQFELFIKFQYLLSKSNETLNLTRLISGEDYWISQVLDSLWPIKDELKRQTPNLKCIDVGSGCGFPGVAVAIALPESQLTLVEAIKKKSQAVQAIVNELGIASRITLLDERVELTGRNSFFRGKFDLSMARAVSSPSVVAEYLIPLIKTNGEAILFLGKWNEVEENKLKKALVKLNAYIKNIESINLPAEKGIRHQVRIAVKGICPQRYPRAIGIPQKRPLGL